MVGIDGESGLLLPPLGERFCSLVRPAEEAVDAGVCGLPLYAGVGACDAGRAAGVRGGASRGPKRLMFTTVVGRFCLPFDSGSGAHEFTGS